MATMRRLSLKKTELIRRTNRKQKKVTHEDPDRMGRDKTDIASVYADIIRQWWKATVPIEIIGEVGTPGAGTEWIEAQGELAIRLHA